MWSLALSSLRHRKLTAGFALAGIALATLVLLGVQKMRVEVKAQFTSTISGVDLLVGPRSGGVQLLLYSVFHLGQPTHNLRWDTYQAIGQMRGVRWTVPLSLGDSHRGYRVVGTEPSFFEHYRFGEKQPLRFLSGAPFAGADQVVVGSEVARALGYGVGAGIEIAHGLADAASSRHRGFGFRVSGVLAPTGTPLDRSLLVSLAGLEWVHAPYTGGRAASQPQTITAMLVGLNSRLASFALQRQINQYPGEPVMAVLPGITLAELWRMLSWGEWALLGIAALVGLVALLMVVGLLAVSLNERRRELALLRVQGARPWQVGALLLLEAQLLAALGMALGVAALYGGWAALRALLASALWLPPAGLPGAGELWLLGAIELAALLACALPAWVAYRRSLHEGLAVLR